MVDKFGTLIARFCDLPLVEIVPDDGKSEVEKEEGAKDNKGEKVDGRHDRVESILHVIHDVRPSFKSDNLEDGEARVEDGVKSREAPVELRVVQRVSHELSATKALVAERIVVAATHPISGTLVLATAGP